MPSQKTTNSKSKPTTKNKSLGNRHELHTKRNMKIGSNSNESTQTEIKMANTPNIKLSKREEEEILKEAKKSSKLESEKQINLAFASEDHEKTNHSVFNKDNRKTFEIPDNSVHLAVTSPPYFNAREYSTWATCEDYVADMRDSFKEVFRTLSPGRKFCLNISDLPEKGPSGVRWIPLGALLLLAAQEVGFEIVDRVIWVKTPMKGFQYGSLPYPPSPLICDSMEYVYILRKPILGKVSYSHINNLQKESSKLPRDIYAEYTKQIWTIRRVRLKGNEAGHIAPYPYDIPERCIRLYSFVGETVLDPFAGSGTTAEAAIRNRRNSIMIEKEKDYIPFIQKRFIELENDLTLTDERPYGKFEWKIR